MATRRKTNRSSRRTQANAGEASTDEASVGKAASAGKAAEVQETRKSKSSRRAAIESSDSGSGRSGRKSQGSQREDARGRTGSGRGAVQSRGLSPAEEARKKKKMKGLLTNMVVVAALGLVVWIGISMMPNPNIETAQREMRKAISAFEGMKDAFESGSLQLVESEHKNMVLILQTPLFAMGAEDPEYYGHEQFAGIAFSSPAKSMMDEAAKIMKKLPDARNRQLALRNIQSLRSRIHNVAAEENLEILSADIEAYRSNPVDPQSPDTLMEAKYKSFMQKISGFDKTIKEEQAKRDARTAEEQAQALAEAKAAKAIKDAELAKLRKEKLAASREKIKIEQDAARDPAVVAAEKEAKEKAEKFKNMTNASIKKECIELIKEYKYLLALKATENFKAEKGADPAALKAEIQGLIDINFEEMQVETSEMRNDARKLFMQEKIPSARENISEAVRILELVLINCADMKEKKKVTEELLEMTYKWSDKIG